MNLLASKRLKEAPDRDRLRQEFLLLYPHRAKHIYKSPGDAKWKTSQIPLFTGMIDAAISAECDSFYGAFFGKQTRFAVLDLDEGSKYHNAVELDKLESALESVGLAGKLYQSSSSGGWHLYISFSEPSQSEEVGETLKRWLRALGYEIRGGQLEIFPSGNALRLPLQPGFAWLDSEGNLIQKREELDLDEALVFFLEDMEANARDWHEAKSLIESQILHFDLVAADGAQANEERLGMGGFEHVFSRGCIKTIWEKGRKFWQEGLQKTGDRHDAVLAVGHYLWYGDEEQGVEALPGGRYGQYRGALIEQWLRQKHNGKCRHINEGNWRIVQEQIRRAVNWRKKTEQVREDYPLTPRLLKRFVGIYKKTGRVWSIPQFKRANENSKLEARERIASAIKELLAEKKNGYISINDIAERARSHCKTVKKNVDLLVLVRPLEEPAQKTETNIELLKAIALVSNPGGLVSSGPWGQLEPPDLEANKELVQIVSFGFDSSAANSLDELSNKGAVNELEISKQGILFQFPVCVGLVSDLNLVGFSQEYCSVELAPIYFKPPFLSCLAEKPTTYTQHQDQALRVPSEVLTPGPVLRGFQAVLQESAGGLELSCRERRFAAEGKSGLMLSLMGLIAVTTWFRRGSSWAHSFVYSKLVEPFGIYHYGSVGSENACRQLTGGAFWLFRYERAQIAGHSVDVNSKPVKRLRTWARKGIRGPPNGKPA